MNPPSPLRVGDFAPTTVLQDHRGEAMAFHHQQVAGRPVVVLLCRRTATDAIESLRDMQADLAAADARLLAISRWITPEISPQRFDTWFFLGAIDTSHEVVVCGSEIVAHRWIAPAEALAAQERGELQLAPPTFVTVSWLREHACAADALHALGSAPFITFRPRIHRGVEGAVMLYPGDAGYEANDPGREGARHRIVALPGGWRYERS